MTNIIFTNPEYRKLAFKRKGHRTTYCAADLQVRKMVINEYKTLPFNPDSLVTPSSILNPQPTPAPLPTVLNPTDPPVPDPFAPISFTPTTHLPTPEPPPLTLNEVARRVLRNQFIDFGDPDHLALIRISGDTFMHLLAVLADGYHHTEIRLPNMLMDTSKVVFIHTSMTLRDQLDFLDKSLSDRTITPSYPAVPLRTYEEIVALSEEP